MSITRGLLFFALAWLLLIVTASTGALIPWPFRFHGAVPELALVVVLYLGLSGRGSLPVLTALGVGIGYLADLSGGAPRGLHAFAYGVVIVGAHAVAGGLLVSRAWQEIVVVLFVCATEGVALVLLSSAPGESAGELIESLRVLPANVLVTGLLAPLFFALFRRLDARLSPDPRSIVPGRIG
jgi:rod shape-determining protein MreD